LATYGLGQLGHCLWMLDRIEEMVANNQTEKAFRWLGFVQGIFWAQGVYSIDQMRDHNRGDGTNTPEPPMPATNTPEPPMPATQLQSVTFTFTWSPGYPGVVGVATENSVPEPVPTTALSGPDMTRALKAPAVMPPPTPTPPTPESPTYRLKPGTAVSRSLQLLLNGRLQASQLVEAFIQLNPCLFREGGHYAHVMAGVRLSLTQFLEGKLQSANYPELLKEFEPFFSLFERVAPPDGL
jgi:hypothetical protein